MGRKQWRVNPSDVRLGDLVRMTSRVQDADMSMVGIIARRDRRGQQTDFYTKDGVLLGTDWGDGVSRLVIHILQPAPRDTLETILAGYVEIVRENW